MEYKDLATRIFRWDGSGINFVTECSWPLGRITVQKPCEWR